MLQKGQDSGYRSVISFGSTMVSFFLHVLVFACSLLFCHPRTVSPCDVCPAFFLQNASDANRSIPKLFPALSLLFTVTNCNSSRSNFKNPPKPDDVNSTKLS